MVINPSEIFCNYSNEHPSKKPGSHSSAGAEEWGGSRDLPFFGDRGSARNSSSRAARLCRQLAGRCHAGGGGGEDRPFGNSGAGGGGGKASSAAPRWRCAATGAGECPARSLSARRL